MDGLEGDKVLQQDIICDSTMFSRKLPEYQNSNSRKISMTKRSAGVLWIASDYLTNYKIGKNYPEMSASKTVKRSHSKQCEKCGFSADNCASLRASSFLSLCQTVKEIIIKMNLFVHSASCKSLQLLNCKNYCSILEMKAYSHKNTDC